ncbi:hypothetical protein PIB30_069862 [Stylosanthes scabra]|uniref:Uncharacterized protein n=1 Tax=Stylosanthes scabra TaxID=79078 RepID=A0ABU6UM52_9FABA|nr:hypothetical protein [Stylosanthes scabra]
MEVNRLTDKNGKPIVPIAVDDPYSWVKGEVRDQVSLFRDVESVAELGEPSVWVQERGDICVEFLPYSSGDRVFHKADTTTGGLKNFFKLRNEKESSASNVVKAEPGMEVNRTFERRRNISVKRMRAEETLGKEKLIDLMSSKCCGRDVSLDEVKSFAENKKKLHGYLGSEDLSSVWSEHFPITIMAEGHFQSKADFALIEDVGDMARGQFMQVMAARLWCMGCYEELKGKK